MSDKIITKCLYLLGIKNVLKKLKFMLLILKRNYIYKFEKRIETENVADLIDKKIIYRRK